MENRLSMADIVNLNQMRKAKARQQRQQEAVENRAKFGRGKAAKQNDRRNLEREKSLHKGKQLDGAKDPQGEE